MQNLSPHLFWDVERPSIDPERHAKWLIKRVLNYGLWTDWQILVAHYGKDRLQEIVFTIPKLDPRSLAFCQAWFSPQTTSPTCSVLDN